MAKGRRKSYVASVESLKVRSSGGKLRSNTHGWKSRREKQAAYRLLYGGHLAIDVSSRSVDFDRTVFTVIDSYARFVEPGMTVTGRLSSSQPSTQSLQRPALSPPGERRVNFWDSPDYASVEQRIYSELSRLQELVNTMRRERLAIEPASVNYEPASRQFFFSSATPHVEALNYPIQAIAAYSFTASEVERQRQLNGGSEAGYLRFCEQHGLDPNWPGNSDYYRSVRTPVYEFFLDFEASADRAALGSMLGLLAETTNTPHPEAGAEVKPARRFQRSTLGVITVNVREPSGTIKTIPQEKP